MNFKYKLAKWLGLIPTLQSKVITPANFGLSDTQFALMMKQYAGNVENAYKNLWIFYLCVDIIAETVSTLPYELVNRKTGEVSTDHPVYNLLMNPNPIDSFINLLYQWITYYLVDGNGYIKLDGLKTGNLRQSELSVLESKTIEPKVNESPNENLTTFLVYKDSKRNLIYSMDEIIHIKVFDPTNRIKGMSKLQAGLKQAEFSGKINDYKNSIYDNQATPSGGLQAEGNISDEVFEKTKERFIKTYAGVHNAGKIMVLDNGLKWVQMQLNPGDLKIIESENMTDANIATLMRVPTEMLGNIGKQKNYANYREAVRSFYEMTTLPIGNQISMALTNFFFPDSTYFFKINESNIKALRLSTEELSQSWWYSPNKKREMQGQPKVEDDPLMDKVYIPNNMIPLEDASMSEDDKNV